MPTQRTACLVNRWVGNPTYVVGAFVQSTMRKPATRRNSLVLLVTSVSTQSSKRRIFEMLNLVFDSFNVGHDDQIVAGRSPILTT